MKCRNCGRDQLVDLVDFGCSPPSNAYLTKRTINEPEKWFPLRIKICPLCWLVQTEDYSEAKELFTPEYAFFSSISTTCLEHSKKYVDYVIKRFNLDSDSFIVEVASNDGYLLQFVRDRGIPYLGIEPTTSTASVARRKGIETLEEFFGIHLAKKLENKKADLMIANNVLAHVPDIHDFVEGFNILLKPEGVVTFEFAYLPSLINKTEFDTMYHEHYSYLSLISVKNIFEKHGLKVFDVERLPTHGGSLRVFVCKVESKSHRFSDNVNNLLDWERSIGVNTLEFYDGFQEKVDIIKNDFLSYVINKKKELKKIIGYGASAKGNTLLNYAGIKRDIIPFVVDRNPDKQGKFLPGSRIPIVDESFIRKTKPDYIIVFPWNIKEEIIEQLEYVKEWNAKLVIAVPQLELV